MRMRMMRMMRMMMRIRIRIRTRMRMRSVRSTLLFLPQKGLQLVKLIDGATTVSVVQLVGSDHS